MKLLLSSIKQVFSTNQTAREISRSRNFLRGILGFGITTTGISTAGLMLANGLQLSILTINSLLFFCLVGIWILVRRNQIRLGSMLFTLLFWVYLTAALYFFGGIQNTVISLYIVLIMISGTLLGQAGVLISTGLAIISTLAIAILQISKDLPVAPQSEPIGQWITFSSIMAGGAVVMYLWYGSIRQAMEEAQMELEERHRVEAELRASETRYRLITSVMSDYTFFTNINADGSFSPDWVAGAFESISGYSFEEFVATGGWVAHLHPDDIEKDEQDRLALLNYQSTSNEIRIIRKDGEITWVRVYAQPFWDEDLKRVTGIYGAVQNITAQKAEEQRELDRQKMLEQVLELGKTVTGINDMEACLKAIHQSVQKGLGFDRVGLFLYDPETDSIKGTFGTDRNGNIEDISWFSQRVDEYEVWRIALNSPKGLVMVDDYENIHHLNPNSGMYGVKQHATLSAWAGEAPIGLITVDNLLSNRTFSRWQLEAIQLFVGYAGLAIANAKLHTELEERVHKRTIELENAVKEIQSFSYTVSHDLRAPLRGIHGQISILFEEYGDDIPETAKEYLLKVRSNARMMGELVDDLLTFLHLSRAQLQKRTVDIAHMAEVVFNDLREHEPSSRQIEFICLGAPPCKADPELIQQVLTDLLSNAIKFTRGREMARIEFGARQQQNEVVYYIRDNGVGFDMRYYNKLFGIFQRLHTPGELGYSEGTGVGLAIVQRIIQKHGGKIWAEAEVDKGATFFFTLGD